MFDFSYVCRDSFRTGPITCLREGLRKCIRAFPRFLFVAFFIASGRPIHAERNPAATELKLATGEARASTIGGPFRILIRGEANFALPASDEFIPAPSALRYLHAINRNVDEKSLIGLVISKDRRERWFALLSFVGGGHIGDGHASVLKDSEMLDELRAEMGRRSPSHRSRGSTDPVGIAWVHAPSYDPVTRQLEWSAIAVTNEARDPRQIDVDYHALALGRSGYVSVTLVNRFSLLASTKKIAEELLAHIRYFRGRQYTDFRPETDSVADDDLTALIAGHAVRRPSRVSANIAFIKFFVDLAVVMLAITNGFKAAKRGWPNRWLRFKSIMNRHGRMTVRLLILALWAA